VFGLDTWVTGFSDETTLFVIFLVAVVLGVRHATDPDHLAAVTTLVACSEEPPPKAAARLGAAWGLGHATSLFAFGLPIVLFKTYLPEAVERGAETAVGVVIAALAVWLLVRWRRGFFHVHVHAHTGLHAHGHVHDGDVHPHRSRAGRRPAQAFAIGLLHGIGGSAGVGVLLLASIHDQRTAVAALALFAACTALSMALLSTGFGRVLASARIRAAFAGISPALGVLSLAFGTWYALGALGLAPYFF
jgi:high-affinity nickel permease